MQLVVAIITGLILATYYTLRRIADHNDPLEPPLVSSSLPFIGHALGLMKKKNDYYVQLHRRTGYPILGLSMGIQNVYIVNSPDLIKLIQKQPKVFAFPPIVAHFLKTVCYSSREASDIVGFNVDGKAGDRGYLVAFNKISHPILAPGPVLDRMNRVMIENIANFMQQLDQVSDRGNKLALSHWLRHQITIATTNAVYGPLNPFLDPKVENAFWDFTDDMGTLMLNVVPSLTAAKGHKARKIVADAFLQYFTHNGPESASTLVRSRYENSVDHKIPITDIARFETGGAVTILVNSAPSTFWMIYSIYSDAELLQDCREELKAILITTKSTEGKIKYVIDINAIKTHCPLLVSILTETLRWRGIGLGVRQVLQDSMLDGKYLLKKDSTIMIPTRVLHSDPNLWGDDVQDFQPRRFMKDHNRAGTVKHDPAAFRGFGGGVTLCPGRHFATTGLLATTAMMILRYDIDACDGWKLPTTYGTSVASGIMEPDTDIDVKVSLRPGFESGEWGFGLKDSETVLDIAE